MSHRPQASCAVLATLSIIAVCWGSASTAAERPADAPERLQRDYRLNLGEFVFDPLEGEPRPAEGWAAKLTEGPDLKLVQLKDVTRDDQLAVLRARGFDIVQYVHPHTYIVWGREADRLALVDEPFVRWTGAFAPAYRVQPQWRDLDDEAADVRVLIYRGANPDHVVRKILALGGREHGRKLLNRKLELASFTIPGPSIQAAASIPGVYSIQLAPVDGGLRGEMSDQLNVNNVDGSNEAFTGYQAWLAGVGLSGSGVVMANVDGGVDETHADLAARMIGCVGDTCGGTASSSHGTHTAGIMAADGASGTLDSFGFLRGLGVAPGAKMFEQLYSPTFTQPGGMLKLMTESQRNGALLSGNSWGPSGSPQGYDNDTMQVDIGVRDADPDAPGNQPLTYVLSFMNGYGGTSSQGTPDEAKNLFNIGSTKAQQSGGAQDLDINDLSANSAHGPALDGRTIPHMVAPGCQVDSTDTASSGYGLKCGTSMASPHVSGAVALFIEYYRGLPGYTADPSPALVKAAFLVGARSLAGFADADGGVMGQPFDSKQGWGRMDLAAVVDPPANGVRYFDQDVLFGDSGESRVQAFSALDPQKPVRIMLVWTDAPGAGLSGSTPAWNNDLDLIVEAGGDTYVGNHFGPDGFSTTGGTPDGKNNTEGVFLGPTPPGAFTVRVEATNINSDGVPDVGDETDQDFALVCYNCAVEPGFLLESTPVQQEVCAPTDASYQIDVDEVLGFSDPVNLSVSGVPAGATATFSSNPITPVGSTMLTIGNTGAASAGDYALTVDGVSGDIERSLQLGLKLFSGVPAPAPLSAPAAGEIDVSTTPNLQWSAVPQISSYLLEVATDPSFANILYSVSDTETSHVVATALDTLTTYHWRVRGSNGCGSGAYSEVRDFTTLDVPSILVVDDDDNSPDVRASYTDTLDALGQVYDVWDTDNSDTEPSAIELAPYKVVVWFSGDEFGGFAGPGGAGETALAAWLDGVGCLLMPSQDYYYDRGLTGFMGSHLGVSSATSDVSQDTATGQGSVFTGLGPYTLSYPYTNYSDEIVPLAPAESAFDGDSGNAAVGKDTGLYRTSFWGFGLETLPADAERQIAMQAFLDWCDALELADGDVDGTANGVDCAPADDQLWSAPSPAVDLKVAAGDTNNLTWSGPDEPGAASVVYDVLRSDDPSDFSAAACIDPAGSDTQATDGPEPLPGEGFYYLIRTGNPCGATLGSGSDAEPRFGLPCS